MTKVQDVTVSHFGVCVSDAERSKQFYIEALGFEFTQAVDFQEPYDILTELTELRGHASLLVRGNTMIELISYDSPEVVGSPVRRPMNQLGLTHMSLIVDGLEEVAQRIEKFGGQVIHSTRVRSTMGNATHTIVYTTDPDGTRIELTEAN